MQYTLTSGGVGPGRRWGWVLAADGHNLGYHDGPFDSNPDIDARSAQTWADHLTGAQQSWTLTRRSDPCGPRSYTAYD
jgi:hypothetical protein